MNLEELKKHVRAVKEYEWCGEKIYLRKLSARDHCELFGRVKQDAGKELTAEAERAAMLKYHVTIAAKSVADVNGNLVFDTDEAKAVLAETPFTDLAALGELVLLHSGYEGAGEQKKS